LETQTKIIVQLWFRQKEAVMYLLMDEAYQDKVIKILLMTFQELHVLVMIYP
jgi:hypothetical protein